MKVRVHRVRDIKTGDINLCALSRPDVDSWRDVWLVEVVLDVKPTVNMVFDW
jgi:hypothetical protein